MALFGLDLPTLAHSLVQARAGQQQGQVERAKTQRQTEMEALAKYIQEENLRMAKGREQRETAAERRAQQQHEQTWGTGEEGAPNPMQGNLDYYLGRLEAHPNYKGDAQAIREAIAAGTLRLPQAVDEAERALRGMQSYEAYYGRQQIGEPGRQADDMRARNSLLLRAAEQLRRNDIDGKYDEDEDQLWTDAAALVDAGTPPTQPTQAGATEAPSVPFGTPENPTKFQQAGLRVLAPEEIQVLEQQDPEGVEIIKNYLEQMALDPENAESYNTYIVQLIDQGEAELASLFFTLWQQMRQQPQQTSSAGRQMGIGRGVMG
jgi:hypothetical protein